MPRRKTKKPKRQQPEAKPPLVPSAATARAIERGKYGFAILRHVATVAEVNTEAQLDIFDSYIDFVIRDCSLKDSWDLRAALGFAALRVPGIEAEALEAARQIANCPAEVEVVGMLILALVKVDGKATQAEARAVRGFIAEVRASRR